MYARNARIAVALAVITLTTFPLASVADWPQWRGPARTADLPDFTPPKAWPKELTQGWSITVGEGHSSPLIAGNRVYVQARQGDQEVIRCLDLESGKEIWHSGYPAPYQVNSAAASHGKGPKSTPAVGSGKLVTLAINGTLSCFDAATGNLVWQKEFSSQYPKTSPLYGTATSPLIADSLCIAHVGGHGKGALTAFDLATGTVKWSCGEDGPSYSSPVPVTLAGRQQIVTQTQNHVIGVAADSGQILWKVPYTTEWDQNAVTLLRRKDMLIYSGYHQPSTAIRIVSKSAALAAETVWTNPQAPMFMSSPVLADNLLFGMVHKKGGQIVCLNPDTGQTLWESAGRMGDNVALVHAGPIVFLLTTESRLIVLQPDPQAYKPIIEYKVADSPTWAHPAIAGNRILIKDKTALTCFTID